jgi:hypothetical protein
MNVTVGSRGVEGWCQRAPRFGIVGSDRPKACRGKFHNIPMSVVFLIYRQ